MNENKIQPLNSKNPHAIDTHIGQRLRLRRTMLKMSQESLAPLVGVTFQQLQKYEAGKNRISASRLYLTSQILNVPITFFYEGFEGVEFMLTNKSYQVAIAEHKTVSDDPMQKTETLNLVKMYWKVKDPEARKKLYDMIAMVSGS
ncbi:MAG: helix-turn-helix domain-containing protein [Alphaproteobacteria bacterium]|nr:helix-turn-helix domain-containing protein [Alphaproteobacteria bacterium]